MATPRRSERLDLEDPLGGRDAAPSQELVGRCRRRTSTSAGIGVEPGAAVLERAQRLLERLGEGPADGHGLADRLHLGAEERLGAREASRTPSVGSWSPRSR